MLLKHILAFALVALFCFQADAQNQKISQFPNVGNLLSTDAIVIYRAGAANSGNVVANLATTSGTVNIGTSLSVSNPQISGDATTGFSSLTSGQVSVETSGVQTMQWNTIVSGVDYVSVTAGKSGTAPILAAAGATTNQSLNLVSKGSGTIQANGIVVVDLSSSQTLMNKTLTSPALGGTVTGNNTIPLTILAQSGANTMLGNWTSGTANVVANTMPSCASDGTHALTFTNGTGILCTSISAGSSTVTLGTSASVTNPQISGDATTGFYTSGAAKLDMSIAGTKVVEIGTTSLALTGTGSVFSSSANALAVGTNGPTNPVLQVDDSTSAVANGLSIKGSATGGQVTLQVLDSGSTAGLNIATKGAGEFDLTEGGSIFLKDNGGIITMQPSQSGFGSLPGFNFLNVGRLQLTASTEVPITNWDMTNATDQFSTGALTVQRDFRMKGATNTFVGASTLTDGATLGVFPKSCGTNGTCTNESAIYLKTAAVTGTVANTYGLKVEAMSGGTLNFPAVFTGGNVGIGTTIPNAGAVLDMGQSTASMLLPTGTTGQRPTGVNGMVRLNTTNANIEAFNNSAWTNLTGTASPYNYILNGDMLIDQQNEGASYSCSTATTNGRYGPDQMEFICNDTNLATVTSQRVTTMTNAGVFTSMKMAVGTGSATVASGSYSILVTPIEGASSASLLYGTANAATTSMGFWLQATETPVTFAVLIANNADTRGQCHMLTYNAATNTPQFFSWNDVAGDITGAYQTGTGQVGLYLHIVFLSGSGTQNTCDVWRAGAALGDGTQGNFFAANGDNVIVSLWTFKAETIASSFASSARPLAVELPLVQRFLAKTIPQGTAIGQNKGLAGSLEDTAQITAAGSAEINWRFPQTMAKTPTITTYNPSVTNANWRDVTGSSDVVVQVDPDTAVGDGGVLISSQTTVLTAGHHEYIHASADARLDAHQ